MNIEREQPSLSYEDYARLVRRENNEGKFFGIQRIGDWPEVQMKIISIGDDIREVYEQVRPLIGEGHFFIERFDVMAGRLVKQELWTINGDLDVDDLREDRPTAVMSGVDLDGR